MQRQTQDARHLGALIALTTGATRIGETPIHSLVMPYVMDEFKGHVRAGSAGAKTE